MILQLIEVVGHFCPEPEPRGSQQFQSRRVKTKGLTSLGESNRINPVLKYDVFGTRKFPFKI